MAEHLARKGFALAKEAIALEQQRKYPEALEAYQSACSYLNQALAAEKNELAKDTLRLRVRDYTARIAEISKAGYKYKGADVGGGSGPKEAGIARARRAIFLDKVHEFDSALDAYIEALALLEEYLK